MITNRFPSILPFICCCLSVLFTGCTSTIVTTTERTAIEQLLLSESTDRALAEVTIPELHGEKVFLVQDYVDSYDAAYVIASIRALMVENGALIQESRDTADLIVEIRVGALGIDSSESLLGIPSLPIPIPGVGTLETPEGALYSSTKKDAVAKIALLGYHKDGSYAFSRESLSDEAYFHQYKFFLLLHINFTNIPEREGY